MIVGLASPVIVARYARERKQQPVKTTLKEKKAHPPSRNFTVNQKCKFSKLLHQSLNSRTHSPLNAPCRKDRKPRKQSRNVASDPREIATGAQNSKMANLINQHLILFKKGVSYQHEAIDIADRSMEITDRIKKLMLIKQRKGKLTPSEQRTVDYLQKKRKHLIQREYKAKRLAARAGSKAKEFQSAISEYNNKLHVPYPSDL